MALTELSPEECLRHLQALRICRLGFCIDGRPVILPVNYAYVDGVIAIRTSAGSKLECAARGEPVAVEIDGFDHLYHEGWSVLVTGRCRPLEDGDVLERLRSLPSPRGRRVSETTSSR